MSNKQFLVALAASQDGKLNISDDVKIKLYGLSKQAREGDCSTLMPQRYYLFINLFFYFYSFYSIHYRNNNGLQRLYIINTKYV